jgi:hypothetical protein
MICRTDFQSVLREWHMALVQIVQVSRADLRRDELWGFAIDSPAAGDDSSIWAIRLTGWALGKRAPVTHVECYHDGVLCRSIPVVKLRPDVARAYPQAASPEKCGFEAVVGVLGMPPEFELHVRARSSDGAVVPLGIVRGVRRPLTTRFHPRLQPLMVTSLGRSGSTWLMCLLAQHPGIVANRSYPYETFAAGYWMHMLKVLSEPANWEQSSHPGTFRNNRWLIGHNPFFLESLNWQIPSARQRVTHWLGRGYVADLARFCQRSIDGYYRRVARGQGQRQARFFAEKHEPSHIPGMMWELYPPAREMVLVRDFRDVVCSVLSLNARRGRAAFGREHVDSDEEYVRWLRGAIVRLRDAWRSRAPQAHLVRYEDLVLQPEETMTGLLEYLQLDSSVAQVAELFALASGTPELAQHATTADPKFSVGRWRQDLSPPLQALCETAFGDLLREFGYDATPTKSLESRL